MLSYKQISDFGQGVKNKVNGPLGNPIVVSKWGAPQHGSSTTGSITGQIYSYKFAPLYDHVGLVMGFPNWTLGNGVGGLAAEAAGANPITISVYCTTLNVWILFGGQQSITIQPGATAFNDPCSVRFKGQSGGANTYELRIYVSVASTSMSWPLGLYTQSSLGEGTVTGTDPTTGTLTTSVTNGYAPYIATGIPLSARTYKNVVIIGDSIADGNFGGGTGTNFDQGYIRRGLDTLGVPWFKLTVGGDVMGNHTGNLAYLLSHAAGADIAIIDYGANDLLAGAFSTLSAAKVLYLDLWTRVAALGLLPVHTTILPRNSFTTAQNTVRTGCNDWIRSMTGTGALYGFYESADLAETSRNSSTWVSGLTTDGIHPTSTTGETTIKPCITAPLLLL